MSYFSTLNESSLHNTLKKLYSIQEEGQTEVEKDGWIYDILTKDNSVIEVQTQNLEKLFSKIQAAISKNICIKVVFPIINSKTIITIDKENKVVSCKKSPKHQNIYDLPRALTGIYPVLLNPLFTLEVLQIDIEEIRTQTDIPVQSKNKKRRFNKNWNKINKKLKKINETRVFRTKEDYLNILPENLPEEFSSKDISTILSERKQISKKTTKNINCLLWLLNHMMLIENIKSENRLKIYKIL